MKKASENIKKIIDVKEIPTEVEYGTILNIKTTKVTDYTHGFHKYPGKFIPQIPRYAIEKHLDHTKESSIILDPFCGSGTTLVEGLLSKHNVIGIDIDPLSSLISKVKTTPLEIQRLNEVCKWLLEYIPMAKSEFMPECENINHWFTEDAINKLSKIRTTIDKITVAFGDSQQTHDIKDFLIVCLSSIIRRTSNADNQSQKTYVSHTRPKVPEEVFTLFKTQLELYRERIVLFTSKVDRSLASEIICSSNNENLYEKLNNVTIDLAITSPPYIKSVDYIYNQMAELFWIGDLFGMQTQPLQNNRKKEYIGTQAIYKVEYADYTPFKNTLGISDLDEKLQEIYTNDMKNGHKHAYITYKYFIEMEKHMIQMREVLRERSHYVMVVGDSSISNTVFSTSNYLIDLANRNGFSLFNKWGYQIKNHYMGFDRKGKGGKIETDWVIDFIKK